MKVVLLSYFTPFVALPLAYLPFKYLEKTAIPDVKLRLGNALEQEDFRLQKVEWINWIENLTAPSEGSAHDGIDGTSGERKRNSNVDFQALISFFASYLFFKFFCKISRVIVLTTLISVALWKMLILTSAFDQLPMILSHERYLQLWAATSCIEDLWNYHKPYIGDYVERLVNFILDAPLTDFIISSLLGVLAYFTIG